MVVVVVVVDYHLWLEEMSMGTRAHILARSCYCSACDGGGDLCNGGSSFTLYLSTSWSSLAAREEDSLAPPLPLLPPLPPALWARTAARFASSAAATRAASSRMR